MRVLGSNYGDGQLLRLALYVDAVEVDKRTYEYINQMRRNSPAMSPLLKNVFKSSNYEDIPNQLVDIFAVMTSRPTTDSTATGDSLTVIAAWFLGGAVVTFPFSASLARLTTNAGFAEVIFIGMLVPCFTWVVQAAAGSADVADSAASLLGRSRPRLLLGLRRFVTRRNFELQAANQPPWWPSVVNVVVSVGFMTSD